MKNVFLLHLESSFRSRDIQIFVFSYSLYLEKEITCDIETLSIDRELNKEHF